MAKKDKLPESFEDAITDLNEQIRKLEAEASEDHVVLGGVRYRIKDGPIRADHMLDHVKKGFIHENQTALTIDRYE